jgi:hypothetical protein
MLDSHSRLAVPHESYFVVDLALRRTASLDDILSHPRFLQWGLDPQAVRDRVGGRPLTYAEAVRAVFETWAAAEGKPRWGDKTPDYVIHIDLLARLFPDAQFVHVIRDGREVAASLAERPWGPRSAVIGAFAWRWKMARGCRAGRRLQPGRYIEVRLDDLVSDPRGCLRRVCDFLGEEFEEGMLDYPARADRAMKAVNPADLAAVRHLASPPTPGLRDWQAGLSPRESAAVEAVCRRQLARLGYPVPPLRPAANLRAWSERVRNIVALGPGAVLNRLRPKVWWE